MPADPLFLLFSPYDPHKEQDFEANLHRNRDRFADNLRVGVMYRTWDRMAKATRRDLLAQAETYEASLDKL